MEKTGDTWRAGDHARATAAATDGTKTAGAVGEVIDVDHGMELAHVKWTDGSISWIGLDKLERT